jgi:hypothetical protein
MRCGSPIWIGFTIEMVPAPTRKDAFRYQHLSLGLSIASTVPAGPTLEKQKDIVSKPERRSIGATWPTSWFSIDHHRNDGRTKFQEPNPKNQIPRQKPCPSELWYLEIGSLALPRRGLIWGHTYQQRGVRCPPHTIALRGIFLLAIAKIEIIEVQKACALLPFSALI